MERRCNYFNYRQIIGFVILFSLITLGNVTAVEFDGGTGEPNAPYLISTAEQLQAIGDSTLYEKCFMLIADIDLDPNITGNEIITDRPFIDDFYGTLNGNGHSISNMMIESYYDDRGGNRRYLGLIGCLHVDGIVRNISLQNITILGIGHEVGGLVGSNRGKVLRCSVTGSITGESFVGGLVGDNYGDIMSCSAFCEVQSVPGGVVVGGLVGTNYGDISNCFARGTVTGDSDVGGLIGSSDSSYSSSVSRCYAACEIIAEPNDSIGGLIGSGPGGAINSFWDTQISGQKISAGGVGLSTAKMQDAEIYIDAGWDMTSETSNGLVDIWTIAEPNTYPQLTRLTSQYHVTQLPGSGTEDDPYEIATAEDLAAINDYDINAHYALVGDIDLSGITWSTAPILLFGGTFDGRGHTISNLTINGGNNLGLFGRIMSDGVVTNLTIHDAYIVGYECIGTLAGTGNHVHIENCHATGSVTGVYYVGGLVGLIELLEPFDNPTLDDFFFDCTADVAVSGNDNVDNIANVGLYD